MLAPIVNAGRGSFVRLLLMVLLRVIVLLLLLLMTAISVQSLLSVGY